MTAAHATVLPATDPLILHESDRQGVADAMQDLAAFGGPREARQLLLSLDALEDLAAALCAAADLELLPARRWTRRRELILAGAATAAAIGRWRKEAEGIAEAPAERDTEPTEEGAGHG